MRGVRGFFSGALVLIVLEIVLTNNAATGRVTGLFSGIAHATDWFVDAGVPGIPDRTKAPAPPSPNGPPTSLLPPPIHAATTAAYTSSV